MPFNGKIDRTLVPKVWFNYYFPPIVLNTNPRHRVRHSLVNKEIFVLVTFPTPSYITTKALWRMEQSTPSAYDEVTNQAFQRLIGYQ